MTADRKKDSKKKRSGKDREGLGIAGFILLILLLGIAIYYNTLARKNIEGVRCEVKTVF